MREGEVRYRVGPVTGQDVLKGEKSLALSSESKGQVVTVLAMKACEGSRGTSPFSSTSVLNEGEWSDSGPCDLNPRDRATGTH